MRLISKVRIEDIIVGTRFRKEMGDLGPLALSIADLGQLQPIGITKDKKLVFGGRRLAACKDMLHLVTIDAVTVDLPSIMQGEYAENELRKDFTPSERVAIGEALEEKIGNRQGKRTDIKPQEQLDQNLGQVTSGEAKELPQNFGEVESKDVQDFAQAKRGKTAEVAAKASGFGNPETYRQTKAVVHNAEPEVVEAMDKGEISINKAYEISKLDPNVQKDLDKAKEELQRTKAEVKRVIAKQQEDVDRLSKQHIHLRDSIDERKRALKSIDSYEFEVESTLKEATELLRLMGIFMVTLESADIEAVEMPEKVQTTLSTLADHSGKLQEVIEGKFIPKLRVVES